MRKIFTLFAVAIVAAAMYATEGALPGAFTINENGDKIQFAKGNLQYQASTNTLRFAVNQYDTIGGVVNKKASASYDGWIDLFCWGTGDMPYRRGGLAEDYKVFTDWGVNAISNGGNIANIWRTLTYDEWKYLFFGRTNAATLFALGSVNGVNGVILLPDNWTPPAGVSFVASTTQGLIDQGYYLYFGPYKDHFTDNTYTEAQWNVMEVAGAVFLPAAGKIDGLDGLYSAWNGYYWSATQHDYEQAYYIDFSNGALDARFRRYKYDRLSVRLVMPLSIYTVTFYDWDGTVLKSEEVEPGAAATAPEDPERKGYTFIGWNTDFSEVNANLSVTALYKPTMSGSCGESLTWTLSADSTILLFTGSGDMTDYDNGSAPWYRYRAGIQRVGFPEGLTAIGDGAFFRCEALEAKIVIPDAVTRIGESAFEDCWKIKFLTLGSGLTEIGDDAFYQCSGLQEMSVKAAVPPVISAHGAFQSVNTAMPVYVPTGSAESYQAATGWSQFTNIQEKETVSYTVRFLNWDGSELQSSDWEYGTVPVYSGETPVRAEDDDYTYTFKGWDPEITAVTAAADYTAVFTATEKTVWFTVTFLDWNGDELLVEQVEEGQDAKGPETDPTREGYTFTGWSKDITNVTSNLTVVAQYEETKVWFTVTFLDWNGDELFVEQVEEGKDAKGPDTDPTREGYTFTGWSKDITNVTSNLTVVAQYKENSGTGLEEVESQKSKVESRKVLRDGVLYIERNGKTYTVTGAEK